MPADPTNGRGAVLPAEPQRDKGQYDNLPNGAAENRPPHSTKPDLHIFFERQIYINNLL